MARPNTTKWAFKLKHHAAIWKVMKRLLADEPYNKTMSDNKLCAAILGEGVFTTPVITREVRLRHKIGNCLERQVSQYKKQFAKRK